jgi:hypothetical protein
MTKRKPLEWYGDEDGRLGAPACPDCWDEMAKPGLVEACASAGIEHGKSTGLMMKEYIDSYHARGHKELQ